MKANIGHVIVFIILLFTRVTAAASGDPAAGKVLYERLCVGCHGADGKGGRIQGMLPVPPRNLADSAYLHTKSDEHLFKVIQHGGAAVGLSPAMRAFSKQLTEQETWHVIAYVRSLSSSDPPAAETTETSAPSTGTGLHLVHLRLSIWPEYDDPRVLVMLRGKMAPDDAFPAHITLPLPKGAEIVGAGMVSEQNKLLMHPHQITPGDTQDTLDLNLPTSRFFLEFYYNPFGTSPDKQFTYTLPTPYDIERLEVDIQQPLHAINFAVNPQPMRQTTDEKGFSYAWFFYRNVHQGEAPAFTISYTKAILSPSVAKRQTAPEAVTQPLSVVDSTLLAFGLLVVAAVVFGGSVWLWKGYKRRRQVPYPADQPKISLMMPSEAAESAAETPNFCSNCGHSLYPEHRFCPGCGRPLRAE